MYLIFVLLTKAWLENLHYVGLPEIQKVRMSYKSFSWNKGIGLKPNKFNIKIQPLNTYTRNKAVYCSKKFMSNISLTFGGEDLWMHASFSMKDTCPLDKAAHLKPFMNKVFV